MGCIYLLCWKFIYALYATFTPPLNLHLKCLVCEIIGLLHTNREQFQLYIYVFLRYVRMKSIYVLYATFVPPSSKLFLKNHVMQDFLLHTLYAVNNLLLDHYNILHYIFVSHLYARSKIPIRTIYKL